MQTGRRHFTNVWSKVLSDSFKHWIYGTIGDKYGLIDLSWLSLVLFIPSITYTDWIIYMVYLISFIIFRYDLHKSVAYCLITAHIVY